MIKKLSILLLYAIIVSACQEKKYKWSVNISAPKEYPVVIQRGFMGKSFFGSSCINSSWGDGVQTASKQDFVVPDNFEITWLSLVERKFYKGKWILPKHKIQQYFEKGFNYHNKKIYCDKIQIGLAPKGMVIVWLLADEGIQIEVGRYQAAQVTLDSKDVYGSSKFMFEKDFIDKKLADSKFVTPEVKENIKNYGYPLPSIYELYREKYIWKLKIVVPEGFTISSINMKMCNGENELITSTSNLKNEQRSIPYLFKIVWKNTKNQEFKSRIVFIKNNENWENYFNNGKEELPLNFDINSILTLFKQKIRRNQPAQIIIKIDNMSISDFYLEQEEKKYEIIDFSQETKQVFHKKPCICK